MKKYSRQGVFIYRIRKIMDWPIILMFVVFSIIAILKRNDPVGMWLIIGMLCLAVIIIVLGTLRYVWGENYYNHLRTIKGLLRNRREWYEKYIELLKESYQRESKFNEGSFESDVTTASLQLDRENILHDIYAIMKKSAFALEDYKKDKEFARKMKAIEERKVYIANEVNKKDSHRITNLEKRKEGIQKAEQTIKNIKKEEILITEFLK